MNSLPSLCVYAAVDLDLRRLEPGNEMNEVSKLHAALVELSNSDPFIDVMFWEAFKHHPELMNPDCSTVSEVMVAIRGFLDKLHAVEADDAAEADICLMRDACLSLYRAALMRESQWRYGLVG